jgi:hypothetical protein
MAATAAMAVAVGGGWQVVRGLHGASAMAVFGLIPVGVAIYGAVLWKLQIEGRAEIEAMLGRMPLIGRIFRPAL